MKDLQSRIDREKGVIYLTERERTAQLLKPILRGRDIKRYSYEWAGLWIIGTFPALKLNIEYYPAVKNYLLTFGKRLEQSGEKNIDGIRGNNARKKTSNKWFETQDNIAYYHEFAKPKIVYSEIVREPQFYLDNGEFKFGAFYAEATSFILSANCQTEDSSCQTERSEESLNKKSKRCSLPLNMTKLQYEGKIIYPETTQSVNFVLDKMGYFLDKTAFMIKGENLVYLNAVLASKTSFWYLKHICSTLGASGFSMSKIFVEKLPVVETHKIDSKLLSEIENLASEILTSKTNAQVEAVEMRNCGFQARNKGVYPQAVMTEVESEESAIYRSNATLKELESRLDALIYQAYGLNKSEIALIESEFNNKERERTEIIENLYHLWEINATQYQGKIIWAEMTDTPCFIYDTKGFYINQTCYFIPRDDEYLCAILNSKLIYFYMKQIASSLGDGAFRWIKQFIEKLPVIEQNKENKQKIADIKSLATQIIALKQNGQDISALDSKLEAMIYRLYNLNENEIALIESTYTSGGG
ncbi:hypothetical protein K4G58_02445 [Helicobacter sp. Faydin-H64]|nr:hypothetical protein [Helicobacter turcicus]